MVTSLVSHNPVVDSGRGGESLLLSLVLALVAAVILIQIAVDS